MNHKKHDDIGQWVQDLTLACCMVTKTCCMVTKTCIHKMNMTYLIIIFILDSSLFLVVLFSHTR